MALKIVLAGAGGLIGSELLNLLLCEKDISHVTVLVRKRLPLEHAKLHQQLINFDLLEENEDTIQGDILFCTLGSTRKKTPNLADYRKVDYGYPMKLAEIAEKNNISQFHLVSALGADALSANYYSKIKGDLEQDIKKYNFHSLHIYQPSLLTGNRKESRPLEKIAIGLMRFFNPFLSGSLKKYRSIPAKKVATAMLNQAYKNLEGVFSYPSDKIQELA